MSYSRARREPLTRTRRAHATTSRRLHCRGGDSGERLTTTIVSTKLSGRPGRATPISPVRSVLRLDPTRRSRRRSAHSYQPSTLQPPLNITGGGCARSKASPRRAGRAPRRALNSAPVVVRVAPFAARRRNGRRTPVVAVRHRRRCVALRRVLGTESDPPLL